MISETIHPIGLKFSGVIVGTSGKVYKCLFWKEGLLGYRGAIFRVFDKELKVYRNAGDYQEGATRKKGNMSGPTRRGVTGGEGYQERNFLSASL